MVLENYSYFTSIYQLNKDKFFGFFSEEQTKYLKYQSDEKFIKNQFKNKQQSLVQLQQQSILKILQQCQFLAVITNSENLVEFSRKLQIETMKPLSEIYSRTKNQAHPKIILAIEGLFQLFLDFPIKSLSLGFFKAPFSYGFLSILDLSSSQLPLRIVGISLTQVCFIERKKFINYFASKDPYFNEQLANQREEFLFQQHFVGYRPADSKLIESSIEMEINIINQIFFYQFFPQTIKTIINTRNLNLGVQKKQFQRRLQTQRSFNTLKNINKTRNQLKQVRVFYVNAYIAAKSRVPKNHIESSENLDKQGQKDNVFQVGESFEISSQPSFYSVHTSQDDSSFFQRIPVIEQNYFEISDELLSRLSSLSQQFNKSMNLPSSFDEFMINDNKEIQELDQFDSFLNELKLNEEEKNFSEDQYTSDIKGFECIHEFKYFKPENNFSIVSDQLKQSNMMVTERSPQVMM